MKEALKLIGQMIAIAKSKDLEDRIKKEKTRGSETVGESWLVFHLEELEKLIKEDVNSRNNRPTQKES